MAKSAPGRLVERILSNELIRRVVRNSAYLFSATGISAALSMLQGVLAARLLGVAGFGVLGAITMFASVVNKFASFRMHELVVRYVGQYSERGDPQRAAALFKAASLTEIGTSVLAYGLVWLLAPLGALYFAKDPATTAWFQIYGLIILANLMAESATGLLQIYDRFRRIAVLNVAQSVFTLALIGAAFVHFEILGRPGEPLLAVALAYMAGKMLGAASLTVAALSQAARLWGAAWWRTPLSLLRPQRGELVHFAVSTNLSASLSLINKDAELLWVAFFRSPLESGYYKLALALANLVQMPVSPMPQATYPELSREAANRNWGNVRYILRQGSVLAGSYTVLTSLALALIGLPVIGLVYGDEFLPAYPALIILLVGFLAANTFYWNRTALLALGLPDYPTRVNLAAAVLKVAGALLIVPRAGYLGSAALLAGFYLFSISLNVRKTAQVLRQASPVQAEAG
jgi:O-antigen/teichoic acid export membrane protein